MLSLFINAKIFNRKTQMYDVAVNYEHHNT